MVIVPMAMGELLTVYSALWHLDCLKQEDTDFDPPFSNVPVCFC